MTYVVSASESGAMLYFGALGGITTSGFSGGLRGQLLDDGRLPAVSPNVICVEETPAVGFNEQEGRVAGVRAEAASDPVRSRAPWTTTAT